MYCISITPMHVFSHFWNGNASCNWWCVIVYLATFFLSSWCIKLWYLRLKEVQYLNLYNKVAEAASWLLVCVLLFPHSNKIFFFFWWANGWPAKDYILHFLKAKCGYMSKFWPVVCKQNMCNFLFVPLKRRSTPSLLSFFFFFPPSFFLFFPSFFPSLLHHSFPSEL